MLEAARILKAAGVHPARTIRFALFTGEEEGLLGSQQYVERHMGELKNYQAVLVVDNGTGRVTGMSLQGHNDLRDTWRALFAPVGSLGPFAVRAAEQDRDRPSVVRALRRAVVQLRSGYSRGYNHTHHSQADTYDHIVIGDLRAGRDCNGGERVRAGDDAGRAPHEGRRT